MLTLIRHDKGPENPSPLEELPPEVRCQVLSHLELPDLHALVLASPTFHAQYLVNRRYVLSKSLEQTLSKAFGDAYAVQICTRHSKNDVVLHDWYSEQTIPALLTLEDAIEMIIFYHAYVEPIMNYYIRWSPNDGERKMPGLPSPGSALTSAGRHRLLRAIYRTQLICLFLSHAEHKPQGVRIGTIYAAMTGLESGEQVDTFLFRDFAARMHGSAYENLSWFLYDGIE